MKIDFSSKDLFTWLDNQDNAIFDELPFGVVKMDLSGIVNIL